MKFTGRNVLVVAVVALAATGLPEFSTPAGAQGVFDMGMLSNTLSIDTGAGSKGGRNAGKGSTLKDSVARSTRATKVKPGSPKTTGTFAYSAAVRKRSVSNFLSTIRRVDPTNAPSLEKDFATKDILGAVTRKMPEYGLRADSVADAIAIYLVVAWKATRGSNEDATKAQYIGVRDQMARAMAEVPAMTSADDATKQGVAETLLLQALLIDSYVAGSKTNPSQMEMIKKAVAQGVRNTFGLDLNTLRLTDAGLQP